MKNQKAVAKNLPGNVKLFDYHSPSLTEISTWQRKISLSLKDTQEVNVFIPQGRTVNDLCLSNAHPYHSNKKENIIRVNMKRVNPAPRDSLQRHRGNLLFCGLRLLRNTNQHYHLQRTMTKF